MTIPNLLRKALTAIFALLVFVSVSNVALAAPIPQQSKGGMRGMSSVDGQTLRVTVILNGKPWAKASVVITKADGSPAVSGMTSANGTFTTTSLVAGTFTVTASTVHYTATGNVTLVKSNEMAFLKLTLAKKPTAPAPTK